MQSPSSASYYESELASLGETYSAALDADVSLLKKAIAGASGLSVIGVGSGGSFTIASLLCNLHESYTGRVSRPSTPLEIICNPTLAATSPVFLVSAEGKNPDIIEALLRARGHSARSIHVITNRKDSPLVTCIENLTDISTHFFELVQKDGYLATNSLLLNAVVVARAYGELDQNKKHFPDSLNQVTLSGLQVSEWLQRADDFAKEVARRGNIIIIYSPFLRAIAADLESKLAESALLHCQVADIRSFAHGRHLWLATRSADCAILALTDPSMANLWAHMQRILPSEVPTFAMHTGGSAPWDLIAGLVAQMHLVAKLAKELNIDPAKPLVPQFGRELYYADLQKLVPVPNNLDDREHLKYAVLGARWPSTLRQGFMRRKLEAYKMALERQEFKVIVFDYDGTLCSSQRKDVPPPESVLKELIRLAEAEIIVGIASGRGGSIREHLSKLLPQPLWSRFRLGLYNCGLISNIDSPQPEGRETSEFLSHAMRIVGRLQAFGVPIDTIKPTQPYQVSVRFQEGINTESMWFVLADALRTAGLDFSRMVLSKHSIDILARDVSKSRLIAEIIQDFQVKPHQILTMGDQGAWPGNDSTLLEHRYSLSVDVPSRRIDRGWNLAPPHKRGVDATLWYLKRLSTTDKGSFYLHLVDDGRGEIGMRL